MQNYSGEIFALLTAVSWTITSLVFESAGKKVGSLSVNIIRLVMAFFLISSFNLFFRGYFLPVDATAFNWKWLSLSGLIGFVIGDLFLFQAYVVVGARISMLVMALTPPFAALIGWIILGENLTLKNWLGMTVTILGIVIVILKRETHEEQGLKTRKIKSRYPIKGVFLALMGALGQATGLIFSKKGLADYSAFAGTQIRIITGIAGFTFIISYKKWWPRVISALKNTPAVKRIALGAIFGPFLGVSFSLLAVQHTQAGIAATLMSISPVLIIAPSLLIFKEKINFIEILGAIITVCGVALFFL